MDQHTPTHPIADDFPIPLGRLRRPAPTPRVGGAYIAFLFGIFWLLGTGALPLLAVNSYLVKQSRYQMLAQNGQTTTARVIHFKKITDEDSVTYEVCYQYNATGTRGERALEACESSSNHDLASLREGDSVEIVYAANRQEITSLKQRLSPPSLFELIFSVGVSCIFALVGVYLVVKNYRHIRRHNQLRHAGKMVSGVLFDRWRDSGENKSADFVAFAFVVPTESGGHEVITSAVRSKGAYDSLSVGQRTPVRYLPRSPRVCELADYPWQLADGLE